MIHHASVVAVLALCAAAVIAVAWTAPACGPRDRGIMIGDAILVAGCAKVRR